MRRASPIVEASQSGMGRENASLRVEELPVNKSDKRRRRSARFGAVVAICTTLPALMGGCPEFRNESVTALETASQGFVSAVLNLYFNQLRSDDAP